MVFKILAPDGLQISNKRHYVMFSFIFITYWVSEKESYVPINV